MEKKFTTLLCVLLAFVMQIHADCPAGKLISSSDKACVDGIVTITAQNIDPTDYDFRWKISEGTFVSGFGSKSIKAKWPMSGSKAITLTYKKKDGCLVQGSVSVKVMSSPGVAGLATMKDSLCEGENIMVNTTPVLVGAPVGVYGTGIWTLNGTQIDIKTYDVKSSDDGKYLRCEFKSTTGYCENVLSNPVMIAVKDMPLIQKVTINDVAVNPTAVIGEQVKLSAEISSQRSPLQSVTWFLNNQKIDTGKTVKYTVADSSYMETIRVDAVNACGKSSSDRMILMNTNDLETPVNPNLAALGSDHSDDVMFRPTNTPSNIPFPSNNYWESDYYVFWTTNPAYEHNSTEWLIHNADGSWDISRPGVGYEFTVLRFNSSPGVWGDVNFVLGNQKRSATFVIDEGTYYHSYMANNNFKLYHPNPDSANVELGVLGNYQAPWGGGNIGVGNLSLNNGMKPVEYPDSRENLKVFGIKPGQVIIKIVPENGTMDNTFNADISPNNGACENFVIDFNGTKMVSASPGRDCGLGIQHGGGSFVVRNITVKNVSHEALNPGDVFSAVKIYNFNNGNGFRYIENIKVENTHLEGAKDADVAAFGIAGASSVYLKNLTSTATFSGERTQDVLFHKNHVYNFPGGDGQWGAYTGPTDIRNISFDGLSTTGENIAITSFYNEAGEKTVFPVLSNIEIPEGYRYFNITTGKYPRIEITKSLPALDTTKVVYDIKDGYYIVRSEESLTAQFKALRAFYKLVPVADGAPMANIKVSANSDGAVDSFYLPSLNAESDVNLVFVKTAFTPAAQDEFIPYSGNGIIDIESNKQVNLHNIDFATLADYSLIDVVNSFQGISFGSLYNCKISDYLKGEYMVIKSPYTTGIEDATAKAVVTYPNPFDNEVQISSGEHNILSVKVVDLSGRRIYSTTTTETTSITIPAGSWSTGTYIVVVETTGGNFINKIVKK